MLFLLLRSSASLELLSQQQEAPAELCAQTWLLSSAKLERAVLIAAASSNTSLNSAMASNYLSYSDARVADKYIHLSGLDIFNISRKEANREKEREKKKLLFVHVGKAGGGTVQEILYI